MTDSPANAQAKAGAVLQAAREEMSLTLDQVADELHLRPSVVKAIEDSNFDEFSSDVFLKGYFRTYCRLVNLHESRMMTLLDVQLDERKKVAEEKDHQANKLIQTKKRKKLFVTLFVFLVCVSLVGLAYQLATQSKSSVEPIELNQTALEDNSDTSGTKPSAESDTEASQGNSEETSVQSNAVKNETDIIVSADETNSPEMDATPASANQEDSSNEAHTNNDEPIEEQVNETSTVTESLQNELPQQAENTLTQPQITASLYAAFKGDCWFKVVDANGKTVIAALKKENTESRYTGIAPFHMVIGDASKVSLEFEGEQVDLAPYTARNGRAELTLRLSTPETQG